MVVYRKETNDLDPITGNTAAQSIEDTANEGEKTANAGTLMAPRAILTSRPNSHPFQERHLVLDQPVKVGRSVARCRPGHSNAIFDCKVLSRNHALLWYENGKFYLQDTKSSNGTFVNNQRLSKGSEESPAREVCSGDIVQFGVDVVENCRKVVHGCVVATLRLYLPDGKEAKASPTTMVVSPTAEASVSSQELYQLSQYLQEALHREQSLESKLGMLQKIVANTQDEANVGWKVLIEEDRLLSRIETLESQLQTCGKNITETKLREDVQKLQEEKDHYQNTAKESYKKALMEKMEALGRVQDLESSLSNAENECSYLREVNKTTEQEMQDLLEKNSDLEKEVSDLTKKIQEAEERYQDLVNSSTDEKMEIENRVEDMKKTEQSLSAKIEALEAENDFSKEQLENIKARFELYKESQHSDEKIEKNGLSPTHGDLVTSGKETNEKEALIQELFSEVNRLDRELRRVAEENNKNDSSPTIKYHENEEHQTNGDIKSSDYNNHLQAEIQQLKKLLFETRESKKYVDSELAQLKTQCDESQNNLKKLRDELTCVQEDLVIAKEHLKEKTDHVEQLESKLNIVHVIEDKDDIPEKHMEPIEDIQDSKAADKTMVELQRIHQQLRDSQNESQLLKKKISDLTEELQCKKKDSKTASELENLKEECVKHLARINTLECETRKYRNINTRLEADNLCLKESCTKLEAAKLALENKSDDYWKDQVGLAKAEKDELRNQLSEALKEIVLIKERFADCTSEKARLIKERDLINEQLQLISMKSRLSYAVCSIPLVVLLIAMMMAFYPSLAYLTATSDQT